MSYCPILLEPLKPAETYSKKAMNQLSRQIDELKPLPFDAESLRQESLIRMDKMSIQGVQQKVSAVFSVKQKTFELVSQGGRYIIKPPSLFYPELPENEALTMTLAKLVGLNVPFHGLIYNQDGSFSYFIKRFDREGKTKKIACEDLAQLSLQSRKTKYRSSMEKVAELISDPALISFPAIEKITLFKLTLFNFLIGNEDAHLKNYSVVRHARKISLSPAYDLLNSTIALKNPKEEFALPLHGKKNNLNEKDLFIYYAKERLGLNDGTITMVCNTFKKALKLWPKYIQRSFLSITMKERYLALLEERVSRLSTYL